MKEARDTTWAVVPLVLPDTTISGYDRISKHDSLAVAVREALRDAEQPFRLHENMSLYEFYRPVTDEEGDGELTFDLIPAVLDSLRRSSGGRYVLAVQGSSWSRTTGQAVKEIGAAVLAGLASGITGAPFYYVPNTPSEGRAVVLDLVDPRADSTVSGALRRTRAGIKPASRSAVLELLTGRTLTPQSFEVDTSDDVIVYRYEEPDLVGTGFRVESMEAVVELRDGTSTRLPVQTVKKVKSTLQNRFIFPVETTAK